MLLFLQLVKLSTGAAQVGFWALPTTSGTAYLVSSSSLSDQISPKFDKEFNKTNFEALCAMLLFLQLVKLSASAAQVGFWALPTTYSTAYPVSSRS